MSKRFIYPLICCSLLLVCLLYGQDTTSSQSHSNSVTSTEQSTNRAVTYTTQPGDYLRKIAKSYYGDEMKWRIIYEANRNKISKPDLIYVGINLIIPLETKIAPPDIIAITDEIIPDTTVQLPLETAEPILSEMIEEASHTEPEEDLSLLVSTETDEDLPLLMLTETEEEITDIKDTRWFNPTKTSLFILMIIFCSAVIYYIVRAKRDSEMFVRRINGLEAIDEAVGRATEMGRPILFVPGISDIGDMQTIAALTILGKIAEKVAEYHTKIIVPCRNSLVMTAARDIVKSAYLKAGYPDEYKADDIFYLTDDQFGYVAGIDGIICREKPAANFLLGGFWAESLIIAETGFAAKAIQISGTAQPAQIPFFVAACDYTLIGEELFAASAYLSKNPQQLGSLKGQDFGKIVVIGLIVIGVVLEICGVGVLKVFLKV